MEESLLGAAAPPPGGMELAETGPFTLTLKDIFTNTHTVRVSRETKVFEVKELLRAAKNEAVEYVDAMALLYDGQPLDDDSTVGSHGLTRTTIVTLSMTQDPELGRAMRRERGERALAAAEAERARAEEEAAAEVAERARAAAKAAAAVRRKALARKAFTVACCEGRWRCWCCLLVVYLMYRGLVWAACDEAWGDEGGLFFCPEPEVPEQCRAGMGSHGVVYKGAAYRTLDGADPADTDYHDQVGCQCTGGAEGTGCYTNWLAVPEGWSLAPHDDDSVAAVVAHDWCTSCLALADGSAWGTDARWENAGTSWGSHELATCKAGRATTGEGVVVGSCPAAPGPAYTVAHCPCRVLLRCP